MSVFECEMWEMWQFHEFYGSPNVQQETFEIVQQEIFEIWVMGRPPKRHFCSGRIKIRQRIIRSITIGNSPDYVGSVPNKKIKK